MGHYRFRCSWGSLREGDYVIGMDILTPDREVLVVSEKGTENVQLRANTH